MCSFLVDDSNEYKIVKDENKNIVAKISQTEFRSVLLNNKMKSTKFLYRALMVKYIS